SSAPKISKEKKSESGGSVATLIILSFRPSNGSGQTPPRTFRSAEHRRSDVCSSDLIKRPEDLKGKKVGVGRFGGNTHYFVIQALKRLGMDATKDIQTIQTRGGPETLAARLSGNLDAAGLVAPGDSAAAARGYRYVINDPEM